MVKKPLVSLHDLRAARCAHWLDEHPPQTVQRWMGHADTKTPIKHYARTKQECSQAAGDRVRLGITYDGILAHDVQRFDSARFGVAQESCDRKAGPRRQTLAEILFVRGFGRRQETKRVWVMTSANGKGPLANMVQRPSGFKSDRLGY